MENSLDRLAGGINHLNFILASTDINKAEKPQIITRGSNPKQIALTFDDGPNPEYTEKVLAILKKKNVKATFFVLGSKVAKNPELVKKIAQAGHEIGNHTYNHLRVNQLTETEMLNEISQTSQKIKDLTGIPVKLFRPPHGKINDEKLKKVYQSGYKVVNWSFSADDFYKPEAGMPSPDQIIHNVLFGINRHKDKGNIILLHDASPQLVEALPVIIDRLKALGYSFVTVSEQIADQ